MRAFLAFLGRQLVLLSKMLQVAKYTQTRTTMNAVPTTYQGVRFRSRLEAKWAAMFDHLGWRWEYEPLDLRGYIPDFVLLFPAGQVLVEVKPAFTVDALIGAASRKIDQSGWASIEDGWPNDALIVGATCQPNHEDANPTTP